MSILNMRSKILAVASGLFEERGIHASGVDTIIAESGIAKATLYKHFPSKNQLIMAFLQDKSEKFYAWLDGKLSSKNVSPRESLIELCELIEQWLSNPDSHGLPFHIASVEFPAPEHPVNQYSVTLAKELQAYLAKMATNAGVKDAETLSQQLTIIFEGAALVERLSPGSGAAKRAKEAALTLVRASVK
ncbi:TetR family transcriptional regulator [Methylovorus sp. MM2]|uniref:TetR/AcrR family transcriptional regulator n=1 Tax=Methylovorus sp. MM2 TaxID=1848038 RepID=UPI0007E26E1F|nr:TetR/AcrR family transcriptional regulator [Methylovorus sp. MM2]OAM51591.1 TetR family transcriptional regulator [Methylovorus sp. MM2]